MNKGKPAADDAVGADESGRSYVRLVAVAGVAFAVVLGLSGWLFVGHGDDEPAAPADRLFTSSYFKDNPRRYDTYTGVSPRPMDVCKGGREDDCVVDGDTFWLNGQQIRISNAYAPPMQGTCPEQQRRAREARRTLVQLLSDTRIEIYAQGRDRQDRLLAEIRTSRGDVGRNLVRYKVALPWYGGTEPATDWCAGPGL